MPFEWKNIWVVTQDELVPAHYNTDVALRLAIHRHKNKDYGIKAVQRGGNGRQLLISFDSLDVETRNAIGDPRKVSHLMEGWYKTDAEAVRFFTKYTFEDGSFLSLKHQEEYITNASVLVACVELKRRREFERKSRNRSTKGILRSLCEDVIKFNEVLEKKHDCKHTLPESGRRFKETFKNFTSPQPSPSGEGVMAGYNYASLISGKLKTQNARKVTDDVLELLNNMFMNEAGKPTRTEISRRYDAFLGGYLEIVNNSTGELYQPANFEKLSEATIINYLDKWEYRITSALRRQGDRQKYIGQYSPYFSFEKPEYSGSILSIDDRQPPFKYIDNNRPWFYMGIDLASEAWICWIHGKTKKGLMPEFYQQLIRNLHQWGLNMPYELECEKSLNDSFRSTFLRNGAMFEEVHMEANNARFKQIERYYGKLRYGNEKQRNGWLARPYARKEDNQGDTDKAPIVPYERIIDGCLYDIEEWNNMPHSVHTTKTRWEVFIEMQHPNLKPINWQAILPYIGYKTQTSCNVGIIKLNNKEFLIGIDGEIAKGDQLINYMKQIEGRNLDVYWLDGNDGEVMRAMVYLKDTDLMICEAVPKPILKRARLERTEDDRRKESLMAAYKKTIESFGVRVKREMDEITIIDNGYGNRTLNRKFTIPGLQRAVYGGAEPETLPELPEDDVEMEPVYVNKKTLADRF